MSDIFVGSHEAFMQGYEKGVAETKKTIARESIESNEVIEDHVKKIFITDLKCSYQDLLRRMLALQEMIDRL